MIKYFFTTIAILVSVSIYGQGYSIGDIASDFNLKNTAGKNISLKSFPDAKGYVVVFTCNHCPYSVLYEDRLIAFHKKYEPLGYPVIAINPNDNPEYPEDSYEMMKVRAKEKSFPFNYLFDEGQKIYPQYGASKTPHVFLLDGNKEVKYIGAIDDNARDSDSVNEKFLENAVQDLIAGKDPKVTTTKAIGCSIKGR